MSSTKSSDTSETPAKQAFREAFDRLKANKPVKLAKGTRISQNNVAKEAGCDPSALKKSRYPDLIKEIQTWLSQHPAAPCPSNHQKMVGQRNMNRQLKDRIDEIAMQRDQVSSLLVQADSKILELSRRVAMLEAMLPSNVVVLSSTEELVK